MGVSKEAEAERVARLAEWFDATGVKDTEVLIEGRLYDVGGAFIKKHPGGSIFRFYHPKSGRLPDATDAFNMFHAKTRPTKWLESLPSRPFEEVKPSKEDAITTDFRKLEQELRNEGYYDWSPLHLLYRFSEILLMHVLGIYLVLQATPLKVLAGLMVLGVVQGRCGWLMHECGHTSGTGNAWLDRHLQMFLYNFGCGMSAAFWRNQHNKHHATPQKLQHDVDLNTLPLLAFHESIATLAKHPFVKKWIRIQHVLFPTVTCLLVALGWQFFTHPRAVLRMRSRRTHKQFVVPELFWMLARYVFIYTMFGHFGLPAVLLGYLFYDWVGGTYIFVTFSVSHTHRPVTEADAFVSWVRYSSDYTTNVEPSWWCNWLMGYLNFQIEHHLFPAMPQFRFPQVSPRVRALFEKHGLEYDSRPFVGALGDTFSNLSDVGNAI